MHVKIGISTFKDTIIKEQDCSICTVHGKKMHGTLLLISGERFNPAPTSTPWESNHS